METRAPFVIVGAFVLAVIVGVFGFVYWLKNAGAVGRRATYQIAFDGPVPGLLTGAAVLFNGIRVGEVTSLRLDPARPRAVAATVAVSIETPVRKDTRIGLDFQGLTGVPVVALEGGSDTAGLNPGDVLQAGPGAGQSMTQAARDALRRVDAVLSENADPLRDTVANLKIFAEGLARNTPRVDSILAGLDRTMGGGQTPQAKTTYDLEAPPFEPGQPRMKGQITIGEPTAIARLQTQRFLFPSGEDRPGFAAAQWSDSLPALLQAKLLQSFENYDVDHPPLRPDNAGQGGVRVLLDLRRFEIEPSADAKAIIVMSAKILDESNKVTAARIFSVSQPIGAMDPAEAAAAFNKAFQSLARDLVRWTARESQ
jgi:phospholipid/cholesterol/gamma-HCH transport system substrate-binding protein